MPGLGVERQLAIPQSHAATGPSWVRWRGKSANLAPSLGPHFSLPCSLRSWTGLKGLVKSELLNLPLRKHSGWLAAFKCSGLAQAGLGRRERGIISHWLKPVTFEALWFALCLKVVQDLEPFYSTPGSLLGGWQGLAAGCSSEEILQIRGGGYYANEGAQPSQ